MPTPLWHTMPVTAQRLRQRIASLIETCKMNGGEPCAWLKSTLEKLTAGHPQSKLHELLPWNFDPASS